MGVFGSILGAGLSFLGAREGGREDLKNQQKMFDYRIQQGLAHGMTPFEMFSGPAASGGGGTSNMGATLGNQAGQLAQQSLKLNQEVAEREKDRKLELAKVQMQTDASKAIAGLQTETTKRGQDLTHAIQSGNLRLSQATYKNVTLPQAAAALRKTEAETDKILNEVATSRPVFVKYMKMLSMGVDNTISAYLQNMYGYNLVDPEEVAKIPRSQRKQILSTLLGVQSGTIKNIEGLKIFGAQVGDHVKGFSPKKSINKANDVTRHMINQGG